MKSRSEIFDEVMKLIDAWAANGHLTPDEYQYIHELEFEYWAQAQD